MALEGVKEGRGAGPEPAGSSRPPRASHSPSAGPRGSRPGATAGNRAPRSGSSSRPRRRWRCAARLPLAGPAQPATCAVLVAGGSAPRSRPGVGGIRTQGVVRTLIGLELAALR